MYNPFKTFLPRPPCLNKKGGKNRENMKSLTQEIYTKKLELKMTFSYRSYVRTFSIYLEVEGGLLFSHFILI